MVDETGELKATLTTSSKWVGWISNPAHHYEVACAVRKPIPSILATWSHVSASTVKCLHVSNKQYSHKGRL